MPWGGVFIGGDDGRWIGWDGVFIGRDNPRGGVIMGGDERSVPLANDGGVPWRGTEPVVRWSGGS